VNAYLTIVNLPEGLQNNTNTRRTLIRRNKNITKQHYTVISVHVYDENVWYHEHRISIQTIVYTTLLSSYTCTRALHTLTMDRLPLIAHSMLKRKFIIQNIK